MGSKKEGLKKVRSKKEISTNIFEELDFENPEEELLKADLTHEISKIIKKRHLTQAQAAKIMATDQPRISSLLSGRTDLFSVEMLLHFLKALGQDIEVVVKPKPRNRKLAHLSVCISNSSTRNCIPIAAKSIRH